MIKKLLIPALAATFLIFPASSLGADGNTSKSTPSPAQQAEKDLVKFESTDSFKKLRVYVNDLAKKRRASKGQKSRYRGKLAVLRDSANKEANGRNTIRRRAAWERNRQGYRAAVNRAWRPYRLEIRQIKLEARGEIIGIKNTFRQEARDVRVDWAPRVRKARRVANRKISAARSYMSGKRFRRYKKNVRKRIVVPVIKRRENYIKDEVWPAYQNEISQVKVQRDIDIREVRDAFNADIRPEIKQRWDNKFKNKQLPRLAGIVKAEYKKVSDLDQRGKKIINRL